MKKIISTFLAVFLLASLVSCDAPDDPVVISPKEYEALNQKHMDALVVGMIISESWEDANEVDPDAFMNYYAASFLHSENRDFMDENGFIPADEMEAMVQSHFDVTTEHLRENIYYNAETNKYEFGGLGSVVSPVVTYAARTGNRMTIGYDITGPYDYAIARGTLEMELSGEDILGDDYKYLSNEREWLAQQELDFPSAMHQQDEYGVFMMESGGHSGRGPTRDDVTWYNGEDIDSIIAFYEDEALPALDAEGSADLTVYEDGWYWSGTYRGGTPLVIDVRRKFGSNSYIITAQHDGSDNANMADNMRERDFMQPPNTNDFEELGNYLWPVFSAGVLDTTWDMAENADVSTLVAFYAQDLRYDESAEPTTVYPAEMVERYVQRNFDVSTDRMRGYNVYDAATNTYEYALSDRTEAVRTVSALTYGREYEDADDSPIRIVITYEVTPSEEDRTVLWTGELEIELSRGGYQYVSNEVLNVQGA
jgi:hypothetical protein